MPTIVKLAYDVSDAIVAQIEKLLESAARFDPNWNGVESADEYAGAALLADVQRVIRGTDD